MLLDNSINRKQRRSERLTPVGGADEPVDEGGLQAIEREIQSASVQMGPERLNEIAARLRNFAREPHGVEAPERAEFEHHPIRWNQSEHLLKNLFLLRLM